MASVSSLDKDLKNLRLGKYTPQREKETREWIEGALGEPLPSTDLLEALKDGVALCKLVNAVAGPGTVKIKQSPMPFIQMEQISHFLRACQAAPLLIPQHDCFQTVDLYERKDPAQVMQCISAFSRRAAALQPTAFPTGIGGLKAATLSPQASGSGPRGQTSPATSPPGSSTWAKKTDVHNTAPAWNIAQYGWTGGASQGNQGVAFGARRQLVSAQPQVPSLAEKERRRREQALEAERHTKQMEEERLRQQAQAAEEERLAAESEARQLELETHRQREQERLAAEEERRRWQAEEKRWKEEEEQRLREEKEAKERSSGNASHAASRPKLEGQYLSQYRSDQAQSGLGSSESDKIKELERQLAEARERERQYQQERLKVETTGSSQKNAAVTQPAAAEHTQTDPFDANVDGQSERDFLRQQWKTTQQGPIQSREQGLFTRPLPSPGSQASPLASRRPLPVPDKKPDLSSTSTSNTHTVSPDSDISHQAPSNFTTDSSPLPTQAAEPAEPPRPLPTPPSHASRTQHTNRTDNFLSRNPAPVPPKPKSFTPSEAAFSSSAEQANEDARRIAGQEKTKAGGFAAKSIIEREMERERERQREWEESMAATKAAAAKGDLDASVGSAPGQGFNTSQYGFLGGDNLNKGGGGVYSGRRQIIGPRAMGDKPS